MEIREARPEELDTVGELTVAAYRHLLGDELHPDYVPQLRDAAGRAHDAVVLVAVEDGRVQGSVTYVPDASSPYAEQLRDGEAGIRMLAVAPEVQGRGVGTALSLACVERAKTGGRARLCLHSQHEMVSAHRIYERLGFRRTPERDFAPVPGVELIAYTFEL